MKTTNSALSNGRQRAASPLPRYEVPKHRAPTDLALDSNEGAGPSAEWIATAIRGHELTLERYPSARALEAQLAASNGVAPVEVVVTAGADDAIDRICRLALRGGGELLLPSPTFEMIRRYGEAAGGVVRELLWGEGEWPLRDVLASVTGRTALIALVSPNNPTGGIVKSETLVAIACGAPDALILLDLAYVEFDASDLQATARTLANVIVVRTLSKAWGLAGLRVGYAIGQDPVISRLRGEGAPYAVSSVSLALASRWLREGGEAVGAFVSRVREERSVIADDLRDLGADADPSGANFILGRFRNAPLTRDALAGLGIAVRSFPGAEHLSDALRITMPGEKTSFARLRSALRAAIRPEALLFDLDGVLADTSSSYRRAIEETVRLFGATASRDEIAAAKRAGDANDDWALTHKLLAQKGVAVPLGDVRATFETLYQGGAARGFREDEQLLCSRPLLEDLASRMPLAIVTGRPRSDADQFLRRFELAPLFRAVVTRDDAPLKPDPAPVTLALNRLGVTSAWMVGDTPDDIRAARKAGVVPFGVVAPGEDVVASEAALFGAGAARVVQSLSALFEVLP